MTTTVPQLPLATGIWLLDRARSSVEFTVHHLTIARLRGRFHEFDARVVVGDTLATTSVRADLIARSVDTDDALRDRHLRGPALLHVAVHPRVSFASTAILEHTPSRYQLIGDLTLNGVTRRETLAVVFRGLEASAPDGRERARFDATGTISRSDYGIGDRPSPGLASELIGDRIGIELAVELQRSPV